MSVLEFFQIGLREHSGWRKEPIKLQERIFPVCSSLKIDGLLTNMVNELSAGEFQKVLIAMTIARECPVMLFDEPFAHLDPPSQQEVHALFKQIANEFVVWISTHDLNKIDQSDDKVYWLSDNGDIQSIDNQMLNSYESYLGFYRENVKNNR